MLNSHKNYLDAAESSWISRPEVVPAIRIKKHQETKKPPPMKENYQTEQRRKRSPARKQSKGPPDDDLLNCHRRPSRPSAKPIPVDKPQKYMEQRNADLHLETSFLTPEDNYQLKGWSDSNAQLQARMSQLEDLIYEVQGGTEHETAYPRDSYRHSTSSIYQ